MRRPAAISFVCAAFFLTVSAAGKSPSPAPVWADSLRSVYLYTEGIKQHAIAGDSVRARELFAEALRADSAFAPAYYELAVERIDKAPAEAAELALRAHRIDTANLWYHSLYGQALVYSGQYGRALGVFRDLRQADPKNPDNYRILAALYELSHQPFAAIATLDSAEMRFGRIPVLSNMKRQLLLATHQTDKAVAEARAMVDAAPYDAANRVVLAGLYARTGKDSLALAEYGKALEADSTSLATLAALSDYYNDRRDFRSMLAVTKRMFALDAMPLESKVARFGQFTSDTRFYREFYIQLNDLASMLAIRYPRDKQAVELYARHLIASGQLQQALELYKLHTHDTPPEEDYFTSVIDIETYLRRPDSVELYVGRALTLFPDRPVFHIAKGNALSYSKRYGPALEAYRASLRLADTDSLRGVIWGLTGDTWHQMAEGSAPADESPTPFDGRPAQGARCLFPGLRPQSEAPARQSAGAEQLCLFPGCRGPGARKGPRHVEPGRGADGQQSHLLGHPCVGAVPAGPHRGGAQNHAAGRGARQPQQPGAAGPLRRHPRCAGRTLHGRNLLAQGARKGLRCRGHRPACGIRQKEMTRR